MRDECPKTNLKNGLYVINIKDDGNGTHWTGFIKQRNNVYYFDSYGIIMAQDQHDIFLNENANI